jgi:hypothetical protein
MVSPTVENFEHLNNVGTPLTSAGIPASDQGQKRQSATTAAASVERPATSVGAHVFHVDQTPVPLDHAGAQA